MDIITIFKTATFLSAFISTVLAIHVHITKSKSLPMKFLVGLLAANVVYAISYLLEINADGLSQAIFFLQMEYIGIFFIPVFWIFIAWTYHPGDSEYNHTLLGKLRILYAIPIIVNLLVWTNEWHHLIYNDIVLQEGVPLTLIEVDRAFGFWIINSLIIILYLIGTSRMVYNLFKSEGGYRRQYLLLTLASLPPLFSYTLVLLKAVPYHFDTTPTAFALSGLLLFWAMATKQLFDLLPIAHNMVVNAMADAMIVLDTKRRLIEGNRTARELLLGNHPDPIGKRIDELNPRLAHIFGASGTETPDRIEAEIILPSEEGRRIFSISQSAISDTRHGSMGYLYLLHDVTEDRERMKRLEHLATHDGLTGLLNHRQFMHLATDIAQRMTEAKEGSFSMIMFDLDHFKRVNDTYGHSAGDLLLYRIGQLVTDLAKNGEICARYGGEEFIILCTGGTEKEAYDLAESIRSTIEQTSITHQGHAVQVTASFGVGHYDPTSNGKWETCINQADTALYRAKEEGRNRVCCFSATS